MACHRTTELAISSEGDVMHQESVSEEDNKAVSRLVSHRQSANLGQSRLFHQLIVRLH